MTVRKLLLIFMPALLCWSLPNIPFWLAEHWLGFHRAWFNLDYLPALLCFVRGWRIPGVALGLIAFSLDALSAIAQVYLLIDPLQFLQLLGYTEHANGWYLATALASLALMTTLLGWLARRTYTVGGRPLLLAALPLSLLNIGALYAHQAAPAGYPWLDERTVIAGSQTELMYRHFYQGILGYAFSHAGELQVSRWKQPTATNQAWGPQRVLPSKLMLIVVESWGMPKDNTWLQWQLASLREHPERLQILQQGNVAFGGGTVSGELRELCTAKPSSILVDSTIAQKLANQGLDCWPQRLARQGYATHSLHAASGSMYNRADWYPVIGLQTPVFMPDFPEKAERCFSFPGLCDISLVDHVAHVFSAQQPTFLYWLTLNSHLPYDARDIHNGRQCPAPAETPVSVCRYLRISGEFFDALTQLLLRPEMQGTDVVIVGDHTPPFPEAEARQMFDPRHVNYLHLQVKASSAPRKAP